LTVFVGLQVFDILTTLMGLQMGAQEGSMFLGRLMRAGPVAALLIAKINGHFDLAKMLLERVGNPNIASAPGATPLYTTLNVQWIPPSHQYWNSGCQHRTQL
jgi:hypothetical protein